MIQWLVKRFVKDYQNTTDDKVRERYGMFSSVVGVICNVILFVVKYIMGTFAHSIAIVSDGFNNLSDSASCIITMFGYKLAAKPADKEHPYGHGRMEYLTSLVIATIIMVVGAETLKESVEKVIHPQAVSYSHIVLLSLIFSIAVKLWMAFFNRTLGKKIQSTTMIATSKDSTNDVFATLGTVVALLASNFVKLPVDGIMGIIVSIFILFSGYGIIKETVDMLLGKPAEPELVEEIKRIIMSDDMILGVHDLMIHNYGPGKMIGSVHVEVDAKGNLLEIHDKIDQIEKEIYTRLKMMMTIHMDPTETDNEFVMQCKEMIEKLLQLIDSNLTLHDFRAVVGKSHTNLIFDVVVPYDCKLKNQEIKEQLDQYLKKIEGTWYTVITFDRSYI